MAQQPVDIPQNVGPRERNLSTIGGAILLTIALTRPKSFRAWLAPIGANMLFRGLTGRSWVNKLLGRDTTS